MNAVWDKGLLQEKNIHLLFFYPLTPKVGDRLVLAASNLYRLFLPQRFSVVRSFWRKAAISPAAPEAAAKLYGWEELTEKAIKMKQAIRDFSFNGEFFEDNRIRDHSGKLVTTGHTTETCQYYAFYFGIAAKESHSALWERLRSRFGPRRDKETVYPQVYPSNAIVGNYLRLELLLRYGYTEQVLQECKDFFIPMASLTGTLWEHSRLSASLNHGFASIAALYIHQCLT